MRRLLREQTKDQGVIRLYLLMLGLSWGPHQPLSITSPLLNKPTMVFDVMPATR